MSIAKAAWMPLAGGLLTVLVAQGIGRFGYTPLLPLMQQAEGFGTEAGGYIASLNYWGYLLGAIHATHVSVSASRQAWLRLAVVMVVLTTAAMSWTTSWYAWGAVRFLSGLFGGLAVVLGATLTQEAVKDFRIRNWAGIYFSGVGLGIGTTGAVVWLCMGFATWQQQWLLLAILSAVLAIPALRWLRVPVLRQAAGVPDASQDRASRWAAPVWLLIAAYFLDGFGYVASTTFLVSIISSLPGLESWGNQVWILVGLAAAPSSLLWILLIPRFGYVKPLILIYLLQAVAIVVPVLMTGIAGAIVAGLLFGATFLSAISLSFNLASHLVSSNTGRLLGVMTAAFGAGQIAGPAVCGWLVEHTGSFDAALILSASAVGMAALLLAVANFLHQKGKGSEAPSMTSRRAGKDETLRP